MDYDEYKTFRGAMGRESDFFHFNFSALFKQQKLSEVFVLTVAKLNEFEPKI
jgi:hypothetical protein